MSVFAPEAPICNAGVTRHLRLMWIGKRSTNGAAGDEVFDRRMISACRDQGHIVDLFHPPPVSQARRIANAALGLPYYRTRFASRRTKLAISRMVQGYDVTICSWEPFDALVRALDPPVIMILHNVTSRALPAIFPRNPVIALLAAQARAWEARSYKLPRFAALAALSRRDHDYLEAIAGGACTLLLPPGMPPCVPLAAGAALCAEIVISGTFDWLPKRRDILMFAREYGMLDRRLPVRSEALPAAAAACLAPLAMPPDEPAGTAIRFGLIADRFEAGHKLKTLAYLANNQIVLSFADVGFDFAHIPDHALFIRRIACVSDIAGHVQALATLPKAELYERFTRFKAACAAAFTWRAAAARLLQAATQVSLRRVAVEAARD